ncbi:hypothetical protein DAA51_38580 [Bradyrhizobium sp. WBAH10]|nr:hypothetical protein [Bradyrhizobium sp. WBAH30]MDD1547549.1 hypothetical protein [Bradyrhizobium sp. WBAH41]MDD1561188.1 hypothetical protein [Bradyrhizobium sp. WBAH23]MDD1568664.1 hypothetical protein [Bradyrhizobium sp. WBAH33]MDD1594642.1 hypothetical protein [Bradyrhizobium sp. WBAH42]NRB92125.1 hypothetical protein [Bradyrhizobium sp. WBAH10]QCJ93601.1 hypothetical protein DAA57_38320 [Bradyrhizobium yuanmingense]
MKGNKQWVMAKHAGNGIGIHVAKNAASERGTTLHRLPALSNREGGAGNGERFDALAGLIRKREKYFRPNWT